MVRTRRSEGGNGNPTRRSDGGRNPAGSGNAGEPNGGGNHAAGGSNGGGGVHSGAGGGNQPGGGHAGGVPRLPGGGLSMLPVDKLKGRENYESWAFAMRMVMIREGTWRAVDPPEDAEVNVDLSERALATICLSIEPYNYSLVQKAKTANEAWKSLKTAFQECGRYHKIGLLRKLTRLELEDCSSVEEYVDEIMSTSHKLDEIGFKLDDEWLSLILLMGLPRRYEPMIMGLDASGVNLTADVVKSKILQDVTFERGAGSGSSTGALATCSRRVQSGKKDKSNVRCFKCDKTGHYAADCPQKAKSVGGSGRNKQAALLAWHKPVHQAEDWILDSGAGRHMCRSRDALEEAEATSESIYVANATEVPVEAVGTVKLVADVKGTFTDLDIANVLCVPDLAINLLSVSEVCRKGYTITFTDQSCEVVNRSTGDIIATGRVKDGLYKLDLSPRNMACAAKPSDDIQLWHRRLGHLNIDSIKRLKTMATGIEVRGSSMPSCVPCAEGKHRKLPFRPSGGQAKKALELVHSDLCGPMEKASLGGSRYWITFIDDATNMTFAYFLKSKADAFNAFEEFKALVENQTGKRIKCLRTDNGTEYVSQQFQSFLKRSGIRHERTVPYNPQQNGSSERMNRTIEEKARCLLYDSGLDKRFWAEAASTAVYLINRTPTKGKPATPMELFYGKKPNLSHLRVFGSKVMAYVPKVRRKKWDAKSIPCVLVGYAECSKGYRVYNEAKQEVFVSRDIIVLAEDNQDPAETQAAPNSADDGVLVWGFEEDQECDDGVQPGEPVDDEAQAEEQEPDLAEHPEADDLEAPQPSALPPHSTRAIVHPTTRRSERERRYPGKYSDYLVTYSVLPQKLVSPQERCSQTGRGHRTTASIALPSQFKEEDVHLQQISEHSDWERSVTGKFAVASVIDSNLAQSFSSQGQNEPPETVHEALERPDRGEWIAAMQDEYRALADNKTWRLVDLPPGRKALKNKWVFKVKTNLDGSIERYKARLVIKGFSQIKGVDFQETYSPVVRYATVRYLLALAARRNLVVHQMDAVTAFLQGDLEEEEIFMEQPEGFRDDRAPTKVCRLQKALYGLKQASRVWNQKLDARLKRMGFKQSSYDTCVYHQVVDGKLIIVAIYVDDFLILSDDEQLVARIKQQLCADFKMKDLGPVKQVLGLRVTRTRGAVMIDQEQYIDELLAKFNLTDCNAAPTPLDVNQRLTKEMCPRNVEEAERMKSIPYRELVGGLQFVAQCTRPDISHAVSLVSGYCSNPGPAHWTAAKRILRYLKGTKHEKLSYKRSEDTDFHGYSDADWGNDPDTRRSVTGYVFLQNGGAVSWNSKRQSTVALSTTEAEYMALSSATQEAMWWRGFLFELHGTNQALVIKCDNKSAINLSEREVGYSARSKHIDIRHHYVREQVEQKSIKLQYVGSDLQAADILTKSIPGPKQEEDRKKLGVL